MLGFVVANRLHKHKFKPVIQQAVLHSRPKEATSSLLRLAM